MAKRNRSKGQGINKVQHAKTLGKSKAKSFNSNNPERKVPAGGDKGKQDHFRSKSKIKLLNMYNDKPDKKAMWKQSDKPARIDPNRKWFGNVRTISQKDLEVFRSEMNQQSVKPNELILKKRTLPMSLLIEQATENKMNLLDVEKFEDTFGPKSRRKKPKLNQLNYEGLYTEAETNFEGYNVDKDTNRTKHIIPETKDQAKDKRLLAGQSKRIWEELYKVIDSSDVIIQVLDARDPLGTRCAHLEEHIKKNCPHKHLVLVLNKVDLIPPSITKRWIRYLQKEYPTVAYKASITNPFGKGSLINILRQFDNFHRDKKTISIGFAGYPNVGKSSVINSLKAKTVCRAAPIPGETKVWQYVAMTKRIYLIDCPGVVFANDGKDETSVVLRGVIRAEKLEDPEYYIPAILERAKKSDIQKIYGVKEWTDHEDFLQQLAIKKGKLIKGGEPDTKHTAKIILMNWQRGEIPYMQLPPDYVKKDEESVDDQPLVDEPYEEFKDDE